MIMASLTIHTIDQDDPLGVLDNPRMIAMERGVRLKVHEIKWNI